MHDKTDADKCLPGHKKQLLNTTLSEDKLVKCETVHCELEILRPESDCGLQILKNRLNDLDWSQASCTKCDKTKQSRHRMIKSRIRRK